MKLHKNKEARLVNGATTVVALSFAAVFGSGAVQCRDQYREVVKKDTGLSITAGLKKDFTDGCARNQAWKQVSDQMKAGKTVLTATVDTNSPSMQGCVEKNSVSYLADEKKTLGDEEYFLKITEGFTGGSAGFSLLFAGFTALKAFKKPEPPQP